MSGVDTLAKRSRAWRSLPPVWVRVSLVALQPVWALMALPPVWILVGLVALPPVWAVMALPPVWDLVGLVALPPVWDLMALPPAWDLVGLVALPPVWVLVGLMDLPPVWDLVGLVALPPVWDLVGLVALPPVWVRVGLVAPGSSVDTAESTAIMARVMRPMRSCCITDSAFSVRSSCPSISSTISPATQPSSRTRINATSAADFSSSSKNELPHLSSPVSSPPLLSSSTALPLPFEVKGKKVKFSHTRYRALGPELIPVYRQSARR